MLQAGCSHYEAKPLDSRPNLAHQVPHIVVDKRQFASSNWKPSQKASPSALSMDQVAAIAVLNNPDLKLARDDVGVSEAEAFAAGLLPDPQYIGALGIPYGVVSPGNGYTASTNALTYDLQALMMRSSIKKQAAAAKRQVDLSLLWQEWQVVSQARILFVRAVAEEKLWPLLVEVKNRALEYHQQVQEQLQRGDVTLDTAISASTAFKESERQLTQMQQKMNQTHHDLNLLLGLSPELKLKLSSQFNLSPLDTKTIHAELENLANRRPDLLALKAGYESEDIKYRQAIFKQFPDINLGVMQGEDNSATKTIGPGLTVNLPIFNRNRGNVAIEKATRQRLYDDYHNRLNAAFSDIKLLVSNVILMEQDLKRLKAELPGLQTLVNNAAAAFKVGDVDSNVYGAFLANLIAKRIELINAEESVLEQRIALQTLLGGKV